MTYTHSIRLTDGCVIWYSVQMNSLNFVIYKFYPYLTFCYCQWQLFVLSASGAFVYRSKKKDLWRHNSFEFLNRYITPIFFFTPINFEQPFFLILWELQYQIFSWFLIWTLVESFFMIWYWNALEIKWHQIKKTLMG